jgi:hypothetical protein
MRLAACTCTYYAAAASCGVPGGCCKPCGQATGLLYAGQFVGRLQMQWVQVRTKGWQCPRRLLQEMRPACRPLLPAGQFVGRLHLQRLQVRSKGYDG